MAESDIIQNLIFQLGQSQDDRLSKELGVHFADVDERTTADLLQFTKEFAEFVKYYRNDPATPVGNWSNFFPDDAKIESLLKNEQANTLPHLALFLTFLELYKQPQSVVNNITARHLDFYYKDVLRLEKKGAIADRVHLVLELKKNVAPIVLLPEDLFSAGKDAIDVELIYAPTRKTTINAAKVESLRSIYFDAIGQGKIRSAPIANSSDGLGGKLAVNDPKWAGFGNSKLPAAQIGFAIASDVLRMLEGDRQVTISLQLNNVDKAKLDNTSLNGAFDIFITGEKSWLGPYTSSPTLSAENLWEFNFVVPETEKAVIDYNTAIHGFSYSVQTPIVQVLLRADNTSIGYNDFKGVTLQSAEISVEVSNIKSLQLESDDGTLEPKKAFFPFGTQPTKGSRFLVGYPEALAKKVSEISIIVQWKDAPQTFSSHYKNYSIPLRNIPNITRDLVFRNENFSSNKNYLASDSITNSFFVAAVSFPSGGSWTNTSKVKLFDATDATSPHSFQFRSSNPSVSATGFITFSLEQDFLHAAYRTQYVENVLKYSKPGGTLVTLNEPYTPAIQSISLTYKASSDRVQINSTSLKDFANTYLQFFHITYFGQMREHGYQRQQIEAQIKSGINTAVPLLPNYDFAGELLIGLSELKAGDSVSVLFQVAEDSANPDLRSEDFFWFVLCDNYWKPLSRAEVVLDTTNQLLTSGIIQFIIPLEATTNNTILPSGLIWIKAGIKGNVTAVCQMIDVAANAVEVQFIDNGNDRNHLLTALEPGKIAKLKNGLSAIKGVKQPYASFGGKAVETDRTFYTRVSERLRHKNRCLTLWDYERIILEAFPKVYKVKCIPHANEKSWLAPGFVLIVVVPDLKNKNALNPLEPKVDADTIKRITAYVQKQSGMQVRVIVKNPIYQKIQVDFKVKFYPQYEFNYYSTQLDRELIQFLSPWIYKSDRDISFGGKVYKSVLLDFVEDLPYVDYVTDFKMYSPIGESNNYTDINEVQPHAPDTILVSAPAHVINSVNLVI